MAENTREIVLDTLLTLERDAELSHKLIRAVLDKYSYLEERDRAFIKRVTEGTIERRIELDYYLDSFSTVPVRKMKPLIRALMRMSVYQILYMDGVPDSAVCNEACKLAKKRKFGNLMGFVNGVLRNIARQKETLPFPDKERDIPKYLSVKYSMPLWLVQMWLDSYGVETAEKIMEGLLAVHPVSLRFQTSLTEDERETFLRDLEKAGAVLCQSALLPYVYTVDGIENLSGSSGFRAGKFTVQDASSAMAVEAAQIHEGDFVIDVCAAPGGKSLFAVEKAGKTGRVLARDVSEKKCALIEENKERMGAQNLCVEVFDATVPDEKLFEKADVVMMDVPCSGLGVIGKKRDIKYRVTQQEMETLCELQKKIVEAGWRYVKRGGILLYSTCTVHSSENEEQAAWIQKNFPFVLEEQRQLLPGIDACDGFYYARFRRKDESDHTSWIQENF